MARVNFKVSVWQTVTFDENHLAEVLAALENGEIMTANDLVGFTSELGDNAETEFILDSEQQLTPSENEGWPTIEIYPSGEVRPIWDNA
jgi:hypothetical protein